LRGGDRAGDNDVPVLRGQAASHRRGCERGARRHSRDPEDFAHHPAEIRLPGVRGGGGSGQGPSAPDRERHGFDGARRLDRDGEVCLGLDALPAGSDPRRSRRSPRPVDAGGLDEASGMVAERALRASTTMHAHPRLFCDETSMPMLDPGRGKVKKCQIWAHAVDDRSWKGPAPPAVAYVFAGSRGKKEIAAQLTAFSGVLQVDGYGAYKALAKDDAGGKIALAFCLAHARRKFVAVFKAANSPFAKEVIERIAAIYAIEKKIRGMEAGQRRAVRRTETKPPMDALHARLMVTKDGLSTRSPLTAAINYTLNHWAGLILFIEDGRLEPDTN